jgi:nucleoside 2-deoxyribosyltransferase
MQSGWQDKVKRVCPYIDFIDPRKHYLTWSREYTAWDLLMLRQCDVVFAYLEKDNPSGIGLALECGYAKALGKTVIFVNEQDHIGKNAIIECISDACYNTLYDAIYFLRTLNPQRLR